MNLLAGVKPDTPISEQVISVYSKVTDGSTGTMDTKFIPRESTADITGTMYANTQQQTGILINVSPERQPVMSHPLVHCVPSYPGLHQPKHNPC